MPATFPAFALQDAVTANGNGNALSVYGAGGVLFEISGGATANVTFQAAGPAGNWFQLYTNRVGGDQTLVTSAVSAATNALYYAPVYGFTQVRAVVSGYASGAVTVTATPAAIQVPMILPESTGGYDTDTASASSVHRVVNADLRAYNGANPLRVRYPDKVIDVNPGSITAGTPVNIWTPTAGKKFRLMGWQLSLSVAGAIIFKYGGASTTMFRTPAVAAGGVTGQDGWWGGSMPGAANDILKLDVTATGIVAGYVFGTEE